MHDKCQYIAYRFSLEYFLIRTDFIGSKRNKLFVVACCLYREDPPPFLNRSYDVEIMRCLVCGIEKKFTLKVNVYSIHVVLFRYSVSAIEIRYKACFPYITQTIDFFFLAISSTAIL